MPKKQVRNSFYYYMVEQKPKLERQGHKFPNGLRDVAGVCRDSWKALPEHEKEKYEQKAREEKAKLRGSEGDKYRMDNVGNILADRVNPDDELSKRQMRERNLVKSKWPPGKALVNESFFFIDVLLLCKTEEGDYLPCEIGLVQYSMKKGIMKKFQKFIDTGGIPLGYRFTCKQNSEETHKIPIENFDKATDDYMGVWLEMMNFVNPNGEREEYPPLYCLTNKLEDVENGMDWLYRHTRMGTYNHLQKIYCLETLMIDIYAHVGRNISERSVYDTLTSSAYDYERGVVCQWHEENESKYCAFGHCQIYAYGFSDSLADKYDFKVSGKTHLPQKSWDAPRPTLITPTEHPFQTHTSFSTVKNRKPRNAGDSAEFGNQSESDSNSTFAARDYRLAENPEFGDSNLEDDQNEPQLSVSVRRPTKPSVAGQLRQPRNLPPGYKPQSSANNGATEPEAMKAGAPEKSAFPWAVTVKPTVPNLTDSDFPALGGIGRGAGKFAGRQAPPPPSSAPQPPTSWRPGQMLTRPGAGASVPRGIGRGSWNMSRMSTPSLSAQQPNILPANANDTAEKMASLNLK
ncbi:protein maelstrom homolog [Tubulanus polymorphus]|uniref:protein maelstrom homolog n=1 Tax=Tubulanus polymorphus TaxID=672921 RepID=UPI003DA4CB5A